MSKLEDHYFVTHRGLQLVDLIITSYMLLLEIYMLLGYNGKVSLITNDTINQNSRTWSTSTEHGSKYFIE